jgi:hypothetical protein
MQEHEEEQNLRWCKSCNTMKEFNIDEIENTTFRSEVRKKKTLDFMRNTLSKMIAYERELKIDKVLRDENEYKYWLC